ncbi:hypothetical protein [Methanosarcina mazei]|nr:hypothetical protein [Methanosarcina mazei]
MASVGQKLLDVFFWARIRKMAFKVGGVDGSARQNASSKMGAKTGW